MGDASTILNKTMAGLWPALPWDAWKESSETLRRWMQIVGKIKLELTPFLNEWWEVGFHVTARGLSTGIIPVNGRIFEMEFDFFDHNLCVKVSDGRQKKMALFPRSVSDFYSELFAVLASLDIEIAINTRPVETDPVIPFDQDRVHGAYDPEYVHRWWKILVQTARVMQRYRSTFVGKSSPVLFYWGSFDLNTSRFSGRQVAMPKAGPRFYKIAEDQENVSCGFWPGNTNAKGFTYGAPAFYSYTYPAPANFEHASVSPKEAYFDKQLGEFILRYEDIRGLSSPEQTLLDFFESSYRAGADLARWDRASLDQSLDSLTQRTMKDDKQDEAPGQGGAAGAAAGNKGAA